MLTSLDETLLHQCAEVFAHTPISDHRFFDRTVLGVHAPDGTLNLSTSVGVYKNNNVMDGFAMLQHENARQLNHRFSRRLDQSFDDLVLGPLSLEVVEPLRKVRIRLGSGKHPASYDIEWSAVMDPHLESRQFRRHGGRVVRDHLRFNQFALASGWIEIEGNRTEFTDWFAWRDHSWGVRPGVGGFEPFIGGLENDKGWLGIYIWWLSTEEAGFLQIQEDGEGSRLYMDGLIRPRDGGSAVSVTDASHEITFVQGTRTFSAAQIEVITQDGEKRQLELEPIGRPWVYRGGGYDHGFNDGKGLGLWRGEWLEEYDSYNVSHPEDVVMPNGKIERPMHREQFSRITVNGKPGQAYTPVISTGVNKRYGFQGPAGVMPG